MKQRRPPPRGNCNCGTSTEICSLNLAHLSFTTTGMASTSCTTGHGSPYRRQTGESLWPARHVDQPVCHNRNVDGLHACKKRRHRPPCPRATGEFLLSAEQSRPWEPASAPRQDLQLRKIRSFLQSEPQSTCGCIQRAAISQRAATVGARTPSTAAPENLHDPQQGHRPPKTNSNCGISMIC